MFEINFRNISKAALAASILFTASCASKKPPERGRGGPQQGNLSMMGHVAQPLSLIFVSMDSNKDGQTSIDELQRFVDEEWVKFDLATGRELRSFAYQNWATQKLGHAEAMPSFIGFDTDLSGSISQLEFEACLRRNFDLLDKDKNGLVSRTELLVKMPSMKNPSEQRGQGRSGGGGRGGEGGGGNRPQR